MNKYKNVLLSLGSYILGFVWYIFWIFCSPLFFQPIPSTTGDVMNKLILVVFVIILLISIFFALRSIKIKESSWIGYLMAIIGIITLASPWILSSYSFWGILYSLGIR